MNRICRLITTGSLLATMFVLFLTWNATAQASQDKVTICHATSSDENPWVEITAAYPAVYGQSGHFSEPGTPNAGHEDDIEGPCPVPETTIPETTLPPETTMPETTVPDTTTPDTTETTIPWPLTDDCIQHIVPGPDLPEGDYIINPDNPTGTTRRGILPCSPVQTDIGTPPTTATSSTGGTLPETGTGTGILAAIASLLLLSGIGTVYATRRT